MIHPRRIASRLAAAVSSPPMIYPRRTAAWLAAVTLFVATPCLSQSDGLPPRDEWQRTTDIVAALGDIRGKTIADIAAGSGYLSRPLSKAVGASGRIIAVEIDSTALEKLRRLARDSFP